MISHFFSGDITPDSEIVQGFDFELRKGLIVCIETNNTDAKSEIISFVFDRIRESMSHNDTTVLSQYSLFPPITYRHFNHIIAERKLLAKTYSEYYNSLIEYNLKSKFDREKKLSVIPLYNALYYGYITFLHLVLDNLDEEETKLVLNKFNDIDNYENTSYYNKRYQLMDQVRNGLNEADLVQQVQLFRNDDYHVIIKRVTALSLKSWFYFLYLNDRLSKQDLLRIDAEIKLNYFFFEEAIDDLFFLCDRSFSGFLGLSEWDFIEREDGKVYSPPNTTHWLTLGFTVSVIKLGTPSVEFNLIQHYIELAHIVGEVTHIIDSIKLKYEKWQPIFGLTIKQFTERSDSLIDIFKSLKRRHYAKIELEIHDQDVEPEFISNFKEKLTKNYIENFTFYHLSSKFNALTRPSDIEGLRQNKYTHFLLFSKMMFVKKHHQEIYQIDSIGGEYARRFNRLIIDEIRTNKNDGDIPFNNIVDAIECGIDKLKKLNFSPTVIFSPSKVPNNIDWYHNNEFFKPIWTYKDPTSLTHEVGRYKDIPVVRLFNSGMGNHLIICDYANAFRFELSENEDKLRNNLNINVRLISEEEIKNKLERNKDRFLKDEYGNKISTSEARIRLSNTIAVEMESFYKFNVIDANAFFVASVSDDKIMK